LDTHPDARHWGSFHDFHYYSLDISHLYWIGGFGDKHYVGWISGDLYGKAQPLPHTIEKKKDAAVNMNHDTIHEKDYNMDNDLMDLVQDDNRMMTYQSKNAKENEFKLNERKRNLYEERIRRLRFYQL